MPVDQFINEFTEQEIERIERKDAISRFHNKADVQGIIVDYSKRAVEQKILSNNPQTATSFKIDNTKDPKYQYETSLNYPVNPQVTNRSRVNLSQKRDAS